ncbi:meiotic nuclear division protein 1 [Catenaria anguillulae PL171]|uniref:Meiotic nuclear division protein 1 n=1 Tax=Catenaria anguillulae PL171 TaxID=765915 RepID=A0A1Y2HIE5_9FUNG|nr:meiotic nuclear division protein 1 [Catenaria anguillulae PL171]
MVRSSTAKGVSADDKRKRMLEIFHETKDVYTLKDLEKIAPKTKGITSQSVKEVLQQLVDDGEVMCEKIGSSNYFWSFPSAAVKAKRLQLDSLTCQSADLTQDLTQLQSSLARATVSREPTPDRLALLAEIEQLQADIAAMQVELESYRDCDPEVHQQTLAQVDVCKQGVNRWTENMFALQGWVRDKFGSENADGLFKGFGVPEDLDTV